MGGSITLGHGVVDSGEEYPPACACNVLKSGGTKFLCPTVSIHLYPPISHRLRTCPPRRRGSSGWARCWMSCAYALSFCGTGSRPSPGTRERGSRFQRCIVDAPYDNEKGPLFGAGLSVIVFVNSRTGFRRRIRGRGRSLPGRGLPVWIWGRRCGRGRGPGCSRRGRRPSSRRLRGRRALSARR